VLTAGWQRRIKVRIPAPATNVVDVLVNGRQLRSQRPGDTQVISAEAIRRSDGRVLDGSMTLGVAEDGGSDRSVALPGSGRSYAKQTLLWVGGFSSYQIVDFILKRTWPTGEIDYVFTVGSMSGFAYVDPETPQREISDGDGKTRLLWTRSGSAPKPIPKRFGSAAFSISGEDVATWYELSRPDDNWVGLPRILVDRTLHLAGERARFTVSYSPQGDISPYGGIWGGCWSSVCGSHENLLRVNFRGRTDALLFLSSEASRPPYRIQLGRIDDSPTIKVEENPRSVRYWRWTDNDGGRFQRYSICMGADCR
jgi:hypothetical protein